MPEGLPEAGKPRKKMQNKIMRAFYATHESIPEIGFCMAARPPLAVSDTPGPGAYTIKSTLVGKNASSTIRSTQSYSLRGREKFGSNDMKAIDPTCIGEPGPGHYDQKIVNPQESIAPKYSFPKGSWPRDKMKNAPGPGAYKLTDSVGKQPLSTKKSNPIIDFGTGKRPPLNTLSSTGEWVGPGDYGCGVPSCEKQVLSTKKSSGFIKFTKGLRNPSEKKSVLDISPPGPGGYKLPSGMGGRGSGYPSEWRTSPAPSMSGRNKFGSPW